MLLKAGIGNREWENEMENWIWEINFSIFFVLDLLFIMRSKYFAVVIGLSGVQFGR